MHNVTLAGGIVIRELATHEERAEAVRLQDDTWGADFTERVPAAMLMVGQKIGGVSAGAFSADGRLLAFVFGLTGLKGGKLAHWSDMLAVRREAQGRHLGSALKQFQRASCRALGVETMYWTYDPLVARNAHLNLNLLGASVDEFMPDMYGANTNSHMHGSLGTDRFVVSWPVSTDPRPMPSDPALLAGVPVVGGGPGNVPQTDVPVASAVVVRIPGDFAALLHADVERARAWRISTRHAFHSYFARGYRVRAFVSDPIGDAAYLLSLPT